MKKFTPMEMDMPWGFFKCDSVLDFYKQCAAQLQYYLDHDQSPNPEFTRQELAGYQELIDLNCENTALVFLESKSIARESGLPHSNQSIIKNIKANGLWGVT